MRIIKVKKDDITNLRDQMWLRLLELTRIHDLEIADSWKPLTWSIALSVTLCSVVVCIYYWKNGRSRGSEAVSGQNRQSNTQLDSVSEIDCWEESATVQNIDDEGSQIALCQYCPNGCQGACACPILDGWMTDSRGLSPQERLRERVHFLLGKMLMYPEYIQQIFQDDENLVETVERKLDAFFEARERYSLSRSSSLICRLVSMELKDAPLRRISAGLSINYDSLGDSSRTDLETSQVHRHARKRKFREVLSSGKAGKIHRERRETI